MLHKFACHPCAGAMLISVLFQFQYMCCRSEHPNAFLKSFLKKALLKYNSYTIQFTPLRVQNSLIYHAIHPFKEYNSLIYHTIHPFKVQNSLVFSVFIDLCGHLSILNAFITPKRNPIPIAITPYFPQPPNPRQPLIYFVSLNLPVLDIFMQMESYNMWSFVSDSFHIA